MNVKEIFNLAIKLGIKSDFRPKSQIDKNLKRVKEKYQKLSKEEKEYFDAEKLTNPYSDARIYFDNGIRKVSRIMTGIDIDTAEILIAKHLSDTNPKKPIDLILSHHPMGRGLADLGDVVHMQADILSQNGIPINIAEAIVKPRMEEICRKFNPFNLYKEIDAAKLLGINLMSIHTPADNMVAKFIKNKIEKDAPEYVGEVIASLLEIPEYHQAAKMGFGPVLWSGDKDNRAGKIGFTEITGGTNIGPKVYEKLAQAGIGTVISMHQDEEDLKGAKKAHVNVIISGHIPSDSIGMNLLLDELEKRGIEIVPCSGLIRVSRNKRNKL